MGDSRSSLISSVGRFFDLQRNMEQKTVVLVSLLAGFGFGALLSLPSYTDESAIAMAANPVTRSMQSARTWLPMQASTASHMKMQSKFLPAASQSADIQAYSPFNAKKYETLSYLPELRNEEIMKQIQYMIKNRWTPALEFTEDGEIYLNTAMGPGYYDNRYWSMYKLPMFGCTDPNEVVREIETCKRDWPMANSRIHRKKVIWQSQHHFRRPAKICRSQRSSILVAFTIAAVLAVAKSSRFNDPVQRQ